WDVPEHRPSIMAYVRRRADASLAPPLRPPCVKTADSGGLHRIERPRSDRLSDEPEMAQPHRFWFPERRGGDSNPRARLTPTAGFQDRCLRPLGHPALGRR